MVALQVPLQKRQSLQLTVCPQYIFGISIVDKQCVNDVQEDMMKDVRKLNEAKKLEGNLSYDQSFGEGK